MFNIEKNDIGRYLQDNFKSELYNVWYDEKNITHYIQFKVVLKKEFMEGFSKLVKNYTIVSSYKSSTNARENYNLIIFFNF